MINLTWSEVRQVSVEDYKLYDALYTVYIYYIGDSKDDIDSENITDLVTEEEFLEKFKEWYENE